MADNDASSYHRFLQGDNAALEELIEKYSDALVRFAYSYVKDPAVAEDIMEDTFAVLLTKRKKFVERSFSRETEPSAKFKTYLYKIARNKCLDHLRFLKKYRGVPYEDMENILVRQADYSLVMKNERNLRLYSCLQQLPDKYREALVLTYFDGFSVEEICNITNKNKKQLYNILARAKDSLKQLLIKEGVSVEDL